MERTKYLPKPHRFHIQWHITDRCNWNCKHCYQEGEYLGKELDTEGMFHVLNQYVDILKLWKIKGSLNITGGEPFVREDFFQILEKVNENRDVIHRVGVMTNGSFINNEIVRRLKELGVQHIQISLEGTKDSNDDIRGSGTFEKIINAARITVEEGMHTTISFTSNKKNYKDFAKVVEIGKEIGVDVVWTDRLVPYGHGKELKNCMLDPFEVKEFYESIHKMSKELREEKSKTHMPTRRALYFLASENKDVSNYICHAGEDLLIVMPNADVLACRRMPIVVGNLMKQSLFEIFYGNNMLWKLRDMNEVNSICIKCEHFKVCGGGARCITYAYCGDPFSPDPQCWKAFNTLPSPEELISHKSDGSDKFSPRFMRYPRLKGAEPYLEEGNNSFFYVSENSSFQLDEKQYVKIGLEDMENSLENIIKTKPPLLLISFQLSKKDLIYDSGQKIVNFLQALKDAGINFKVLKPLPKCLFGFEYQNIIKKFGIPSSCRDCMELFHVNENGKIELCIGESGPNLKYMDDRDQIYEYFEFFHEKLKPDERCVKCLWFLRKQCNGFRFCKGN